MGADVTLIAASVLLLLLLSTGGRDGSLVAATSSSSPVSNSESAARSVVTSSCRRLNVEEDGETGDSCPPVSDDKPSAIYVSEERDSGQSTKTTATRGEAEREDDTRRNCQDEFKLLPVPDEVVTHGRPMTYFDRVDVAVESLMTTYGVTTYVELTKSSTIEGALNLMLPLMQPDAVVALQLQTPADGLAAIKQHEIDGLFETYRVPTDGCLTVTLNRISSDHPGPKLYAIDVSRFPTSQFVAYMQTLFGVVTASDIILLTEVVAIESSEEALRGAVCHVARPRWILHRLSSRHWFVKPEIVRGPLLPVVPPLPVCSGSSKESATAGVVDVILFTKNRPLQVCAHG